MLKRSFSEFLKSILFRSRFLTDSLRQVRVISHFIRRKPHEVDFRFLRDPQYSKGLLLDLGANIGQSAISALAVRADLEVISIEANPACQAGLRMTKRLLGNRFSYRVVGVAEAAGELSFFVPCRSSRMLLEEGTFDRRSLTSPGSIERLGREGVDFEVKVLRIPLIPVDSLNLTPNIVKMDLQGLELAALIGMRSTIERAKPTFMIEIGERHEEVVQYLQELGYRAYFWDRDHLHLGHRATALNAIFVPATTSGNS